MKTQSSYFLTIPTLEAVRVHAKNLFYIQPLGFKSTFSTLKLLGDIMSIIVFIDHTSHSVGLADFLSNCPLCRSVKLINADDCKIEYNPLEGYPLLGTHHALLIECYFERRVKCRISQGVESGDNKIFIHRTPYLYICTHCFETAFHLSKNNSID